MTEIQTSAATDEAHGILRRCVHCGFCLATCPTYYVLGDERDSPRGRIHMMKEMLTSGAPASPAVVPHIDRCLGCLSCATTCPSGVDYAHLVDEARIYIERTYTRPLPDRVLRWALGWILPHKGRMRMALALGTLARPLRPVAPKLLRPLFDLARTSQESLAALPGPKDKQSARPRVGLLTGCVQDVLAGHVHDATIRLLDRCGVDVICPDIGGCCGALNHHLGQDISAKDKARRTIEAFWSAHQEQSLDAIIINASGCGTMLKDYAHLFANDPEMADKAEAVAGLAKDVSEYLSAHTLPIHDAGPLPVVAYHSACSLQHGQQITEAPQTLLKAAGFRVLDVPGGHLCCGSAGTYNILQPDMAEALKARKVSATNGLGADIVSAGNIGCITHLADGLDAPIVNTVELLDWATGGPTPPALNTFKGS